MKGVTTLARNQNIVIAAGTAFGYRQNGAGTFMGDQEQ